MKSSEIEPGTGHPRGWQKVVKYHNTTTQTHGHTHIHTNETSHLKDSRPVKNIFDENTEIYTLKFT